MAIDLAGIASLVGGVGGLFGGTSQGKAVDNTRKATERMLRHVGLNVRAGAEASGFNPLTYLMATGGPGSISASGDAGNVMPAFGMISDGLRSMSVNRTTEQLERETVRDADEQLKRVKADQKELGGARSVVLSTGAPATRLSLPKASPGPNNAETRVAAQTQLVAPLLPPTRVDVSVLSPLDKQRQYDRSQDDPAMSDEGTDPPEKPLRYFGGDWYDFTNSSDHESFETRDGDFIAEIMSIPKAAVNIPMNFLSRTEPSVAEREVSGWKDQREQDFRSGATPMRVPLRLPKVQEYSSPKYRQQMPTKGVHP